MVTTALHKAARRGDIEGLQRLIDEGTYDVNEGGDDPFLEGVSLALQRETRKQWKLTLFSHTMNHSGYAFCVYVCVCVWGDWLCWQTPLHWAAFGGHSECVRQLIAANANANAKDVSKTRDWEKEGRVWIIRERERERERMTRVSLPHIFLSHVEQKDLVCMTSFSFTLSLLSLSLLVSLSLWSSINLLSVISRSLSLSPSFPVSLSRFLSLSLSLSLSMSLSLFSLSFIFLCFTFLQFVHSLWMILAGTHYWIGEWRDVTISIKFMQNTKKSRKRKRERNVDWERERISVLTNE